jgi:hypothetical protein
VIHPLVPLQVALVKRKVQEETRAMTMGNGPLRERKKVARVVRVDLTSRLVGMVRIP